MKYAVVSLLLLPPVVYLVIRLNGDGDGRGEAPVQPKRMQTELQRMPTFHDRDGGYRIAYPSDWMLDDRTAANQMIRADMRQRQTIGFQIRMYEDVRGGFDAYVDRYADRFIEDMRGHWGGEMSVVGREHGPIGKHPGSRLSYVLHRRDGQKWFFKQYLWPQDKRVIVLQCGTPAELRKKAEPVLDRIAETFEFVP